MTAFFIATSRILDVEKYKQYGSKAGPTFAEYGGKLVTKGKTQEALDGKADYDVVAVVSFPDMEKLNEWYHSDAYQQLIPLRNQAAQMTLVSHIIPD